MLSVGFCIMKEEKKPFDSALLKYVPKFNGNPFSFVSFIYAFEKNVHDTDAPWFEKLNILKRYLDDDDLKKKLSNSSYDLAFKQLKEHYRLQTQNLDYLNDIYAVEDPENYEDLQTTIYEFRLVCESIEYFSLKKSVSNKLLKTALKMFPSCYVKDYLRRNHLKCITISGLLEYMNDIVENKDNLAQKLEHFGLKTENKKNSFPKRYSDFVEDRDWPGTCRAHLSSEARIRKAQQRNLCLNCLRNNHKTSKCRVKNNCDHCPKRHHTIFCKETSSLKYERWIIL